ncbi:MAG: penicillin-binding protein 2, partial [Pseudomonadales bacterium]|nr:penicillin-binding protein 2 [Pseudomonadales bacterium]
MKPIKKTNQNLKAYPWRFKFALGLLSLVFGVMIWRVVDLQVLNHDFLNNQGEARSVRIDKLTAHRGMILDRNDQPLAVSTPVVSIWINPKEIVDVEQTARHLAKPLELSEPQLRQRLEKSGDRSFVYLKRHLPPAVAEKILALKVEGVRAEKEYRRYYRAAEVAAHLVGFTDIDDLGQEGMELAYDSWLKGVAGKKLVMKDRYGRIIKDLQLLQEEKPGQNLHLSIDLRLQYLAYRELKAAVSEHHAKSGTLVLLDAQTGEVLALVNQPSYNPNNRGTMNHANLRNRALTDVFEPGSTMKPLTIAAAVDSGNYNLSSKIDTSPGYLRVGRNTIRDHRNYGVIDLTTLLSKSSNVGASKIALSMDADILLSMFSQLRLGQDTGSGFPGERGGLLPYRDQWRDIELATLSYGYGLSVTPLQLAQAYTAFANQGELKPISLLMRSDKVSGVPVMKAETAQTVMGMLEKVIEQGGTGTRAQVPYFRVGGKTG